MSKNSYSFNTVPTIHMPRSVFDLSHSQLTSQTVGRLQPHLVQEVLPGDTFMIDTDTVCKVSSAFLKPPAGSLYYEEYYFFVPSRLCMKDWSNVVGLEADPDSWTTPDNVTVPMVSGIPKDKTVADFMRIPKRGVSVKVSVLPFRAFALVYDVWFRNQNVIDKMLIADGDVLNSYETAGLNTNGWTVSNYLGKCPSVGKYKDLFTSCLPSPQKGEAVGLPVGIPDQHLAVYGNNATQDHTYNWSNWSNGARLQLKTNLDGSLKGGYFAQFNDNAPPPDNAYKAPTLSVFSSGNGFDADLGDANVGNVGSVIGTNLYVPGVDTATFTVNDLRTAFAMQRSLEKLARVGSRYQEILNGIWGVNSPDARLQRPEYLAGKKTLINFQQVAQTSNVQNQDEPTASLTAYSNTLARTSVKKTFVEHGFIIGVSCIRQKHIYQQGLERFWTRSSKNDFYEPSFAHIGEQPVYQNELFYVSNTNQNIFGYQEAWYDYRQRSGAVTGDMSSLATNSLDIWHFGDLYSSQPVLSKEFVEEVPTYVDRTLAVASNQQDQFIIDSFFNVKAIRRLPPRSIPGLIDHY